MVLFLAEGQGAGDGRGESATKDKLVKLYETHGWKEREGLMESCELVLFIAHVMKARG